MKYYVLVKYANRSVESTTRTSRQEIQIGTLAKKQVHKSLFIILSEIPFVFVAAQTKTTSIKENTDENRLLTSEFNRDKQ